jgi:hypothetical protein
MIDAEAAAIAMGGQLAGVTSAAQDQFIYSLAASVDSLWAPAGRGNWTLARWPK